MNFLGKLFGSKAAPLEQPIAQRRDDVPALLTTPTPNPTTSKSELVVQALIPITKQNWPHAQNLMSKKIWLAGDKDLSAILDGYNPDAPGSYVRKDNPDQPFIVNGNQARIQLWTRKDMPVEARHMVMIQSAVIGNAEKVISYRPQMIVRGTGAPFIMIYRMSCCSATSFSALVSAGDKSGQNISNVIDSNPTGILSGMGSGIFYDSAAKIYKIRVASSPDDCQVLETMHGHITATGQHALSSPSPMGRSPQ
ncbi:MAG: hypothetical protein PHX61_03150 [Alphaproteobacteria bacterium]|nr:hypothetical protein [Alphaproteobacteria bacterium]